MNNDFDRAELLDLIPVDAKRILDVGCGTGRLGAALMARQECEVFGIDIDAAAVEQAQARGVKALHGDIGEGGDAYLVKEHGPYDAVVCADVLEHLRDPRTVLAWAREAMTAGATLVVSVPNMRHVSVLQQLAEGVLSYEDAGLLDRSHLRWFTRRSIEQLIDGAGFELCRKRGVQGDGYEEWEAGGKQGRAEAGRMSLTGLSEQDAQELFIYQWHIAARPRPVDYGTTSIIIPTCNLLPHTRQCLQYIRTHTPEAHEIIVVDNGSTDGTPEWLEAQPDVTLVRNETNRGFPAACNQGLEVATGDTLVLLNNDVVVTAGWLRRLVECLRTDGVGMAGPRSNNVSGIQQLATEYRNLVEMEAFAWDWTLRRRGEYIPTQRLVGFCLAVRREVVDAIGVLDEQFGIGCYEDDDWGRRAEAAGWQLAIANDCFVHHWGSRTFGSLGISYQQIMAENAAKFREKWLQSPGPASPPQPGAPPPP